MSFVPDWSLSIPEASEFLNTKTLARARENSNNTTLERCRFYDYGTNQDPDDLRNE